MADEATRTGRELWARLAADGTDAPMPPEPDPLALAAWLDGRLGEDEAGPVEAWIAAHPDAAAFAAYTREGGAEAAGAAEPPPALTARARALIGGRARAHGRAEGWARRGFLDWLLTPATGAAFAAMLIAAVGGFELGSATFTDIEAVDAGIAEQMWLVEEADPALQEG